MYACAECGRAACCESPDTASYPRGCPSRDPFESEVLSLYQEGEDAHLARNAGLVEGHGYCRLTRIEEIMDFARRCGYAKLGLAFCIGLQSEAAVTSRVLRANGYSVDSVACKNGSLPKEVLGLSDEDKVHAGEFESMCNPLGQARALDQAGTELNLLLGLCVGHDSLFMKHSVAPVTVLAAKDRVLGHNPLAAIYMADGYYCDKLFPKDREGGCGWHLTLPGGFGTLTCLDVQKPAEPRASQVLVESHLPVCPEEVLCAEVAHQGEVLASLEGQRETLQTRLRAVPTLGEAACSSAQPGGAVGGPEVPDVRVSEIADVLCEQRGRQDLPRASHEEVVETARTGLAHAARLQVPDQCLAVVVPASPAPAKEAQHGGTVILAEDEPLTHVGIEVAPSGGDERRNDREETVSPGVVGDAVEFTHIARQHGGLVAEDEVLAVDAQRPRPGKGLLEPLPSVRYATYLVV